MVMTNKQITVLLNRNTGTDQQMQPIQSFNNTTLIMSSNGVWLDDYVDPIKES